MIVLDCTFRDGGYYNNWEFDIDLVNKYLTTMNVVGVDAIEIGFRSSYGKNIGRFGKVTDEFIEEKLNIQDFKYFGVMVNANEFDKTSIESSFNRIDEAPINMVRVTTHFKDILITENICKSLKDLGYFVSCNLMQVAGKSFDEIMIVAKKINSWKSVDVLYLADSFGGMNHDDVNYAFKAIAGGWNGLIGFHGHNNRGQALSNSLEAIDIGVDFIDATVAGIGRGPGNTEIEYLLTELNKRDFEFNLEEIYNLALNDFSNLKNRYGWGPSLPYYLSAEYNIHPTFIQNLLTCCEQNKVLKSIFYLKDKNSSSFCVQLLEESMA